MVKICPFTGSVFLFTGSWNLLTRETAIFDGNAITDVQTPASNFRTHWTPLLPRSAYMAVDK
jgi:hypothetical protein